MEWKLNVFNFNFGTTSSLVHLRNKHWKFLFKFYFFSLILNLLKPFCTTSLFLYPLKSQKSQVFYVYSGYRKRPLAWNGLNSIYNSLLMTFSSYTAWKVSKYGYFSGPYFPSFGLNVERYSVKIRRKYGTEKNSVFGHFSGSVKLKRVVF